MPKTQPDVCRVDCSNDQTLDGWAAIACVRVSTNFDQEFSIDRFWGGLLPVDPMDYVTRATLRLEQLDPGRRRFHETY